MRTIPLILFSLLLPPTLQADIIYSVSLNTTALPSGGTFYLDFQFFDGSGLPSDLNNNSVAISNLALGGGATTGTPAFTGGGAGDASAGFTLNDTQFFNEVLQAFHPGSFLTFQVALTTAIDPGGTPDQLSFAILDSTLLELPTNGVANELLSITLNGTPPTVATYGTASGSPYSIAAPSVQQTDIPEPGGTGALLTAVLVGFLLAKRVRAPAQ
ncbi:MAG: NF038129 family PEP-CTERM protein [Bryobacterales bacterium]|nr:NF038129 family PEP-CTERM protein [Bryobacterales bacterium]